MKKFISVFLAALILTLLLAGCGAKPGSTSTSQAGVASQDGSGSDRQNIVLPEYIEFQRDNPGFLPVEKDGEMYNFYKDILGFGVIMPYIEWNGGCCFSERMRKLFRKNEKNVLRFCNKKAKEKRRLQRVKKPM